MVNFKSHHMLYLKRALFAWVVLGSFVLRAQQDPEYTQYMYNMNIINPAYATGDIQTLNIGALYRNQWVGADGAPVTMTAFLHTPLNESVEIGISFIRDEIGDGALNENNINADFAYVLPIGRDLNLSFGVKAGVTTFDTRFNDFQLNSGDFTSDPAFGENISSIFLNVGTGLFLYGNNFYFGASVPNFLDQKHIEERNGINALGAEELHGFLTAGYVFDINDNLKFKPSFMGRLVPNAPFSLDVNANFLINERFEVGLSHRLDDSISGMFNVAVTEKLRLGYAYDYTTSNFGDFNSGTHEIILLFDLSFSGGRSYISPRFF